jgi:hypothetical protein
MAKKKKINNPKGAGRKAKFNEVTTVVSRRVPKSKKQEFENYVDAKLAEWSQGGI